MNRKKIFTKKKVTGVAALLVAIAIVITGTFAWIDVSQFALNELDGETQAHWVDLINDFKDADVAGGQTLTGWKKGDVAAKEVYVTSDIMNSKADPAATGYNSALTADDYGSLYVRVQLEQTLTLGGTDVDPASDTNVSMNQYSDKIAWTHDEIKTIAEWEADALKTDAYWILDDTTGWLYWSEPLEFGDTTSHLLDTVELLVAPVGGLSYKVNVKLEAVSSDFDNTNGDGIYEGGFADWEIPADAAIMPLFGASNYTIESEKVVMTALGSTQQLTLARTPDNGVTTTATWTSSNTAVATVDSATGVVTAVANGTTTISAVAADGQIVAETEEVIVATVGTTFTVSGSATLWRVLVPEDVDGNVLIITENVYNRNTTTPIRYNTGTAPGAWSLYESSNLKNNATYGMDAWYDSGTNVGTAIKEKAIDYAYQDNAGATVAKGGLGAGIEYDFDGNNWATWATHSTSVAQRAITKAGAIDSTGTVFALSIAEVNTYFASGALNKAATGDDGTGTIGVRTWWLRSPGNNSSSPASVVNTAGGNVNNDNATCTSSGFRAALWLHQ